MTWVPTGSLLLNLREGEISGHEDVEKLTIYHHLGSVSLCQGSQRESAPWGPVCSELQKYVDCACQIGKIHRSEAF